MSHIKASNEICFIDGRDSFSFQAWTNITIDKEISALRVVYEVYDIFGLHMRNLLILKVEDYTAGSHKICGSWDSHAGDYREFLTSIVYVNRVRFKDGTQWVSNDEKILGEIVMLNLEKKIKDDDK